MSKQDDEFQLPTEHVAKCCWCSAALQLEPREDNDDRPPVAWCTGKEECRQRQRDAGIWEELNGEIRWLFLPTPRQVECMVSRVKNLFIWGNRGGGKSVCIRWLCHALARAIPGFKYSILRTSFVELEKNHLIFLEGEMKKLGGTYHATSHMCKYPNGSIGFYAQCETDADVKKVLGAEVSLLVFDEAPTFQWSHIRLIAGSVRSPKGAKIRPRTLYLGNPTGDCIDELFSYCIDKDVRIEDDDEDDDVGDPEYDPNDWGAIEIRLEDNPHLDFKEYRKQFAGQPKHIRKAWLQGVRSEERTLFEFKPWVYDEENSERIPYHVIHELPRLEDDTPIISFNDQTQQYDIPSWIRIIRAYDHGYYPDPAVVLWFAIVGRMIICFKEKFYYRKIIRQIAADVNKESRGMNVITTYCDPSIDIKTGKDIHTMKQDFENKPNNIAMDCAVNDRQLFADVIHRLLGEQIGPNQPRIVFYDRGCPQLIKYIPRMKWDENDPAKMAEHKHDHAPVALAYFGMSQIPTTKRGDSKKQKRWMKKKKKTLGKYGRK